MQLTQVLLTLLAASSVSANFVTDDQQKVITYEDENEPYFKEIQDEHYHEKDEDKHYFHEIKHKLRKAAIIPDIIDSKDWKPQCYVVPIYKKDKKHEKYVTLGNTIKPKKTQKKPDVKIYCPGKEVTTGMTVVLTDPDAPSRKDPKWSEMCHWIAGVPASKPEVDESEGLLFEVEGGKKPSSKYDIVDYKPPGPPPKTGKHRYVFLLLEGDNTNLTIPEDRKHWGFGKEGYGVKDWAKREGLEVVGANFFYAKNKDKTKH